jgi:hypothetical protein
MNKLIKHIQILNIIYKNMKHNFITLHELYKNHSTINQKIILAEKMADQVYLSIMEKLESEETAKQFFKIIKGINNVKNR